MNYDAAALEARTTSAVAEIVDKQVESGIDVVNDGEMSKINYATYVKDRVSGFEGEDETRVYGSDLAAFPEYLDRLFAKGGIAIMKRPVCTGPIGYRGEAAVAADIANLKAATGGARRRIALLTRPRRASLHCFSATPTTRATRSTSGAGRGDEDRVRHDHRRRHSVAARCPRPRHGPAHPIRR